MKPCKTLAIALSALALSACVVAPAQPDYVYTDSGAPLVIADGPPPAPYTEVVPAMPFPGAVWIGGYWGWSAGRHAWVGGHWDRPRRGYAWVPHRWEHRGGHWQLRGGGWARR